MTLLLLPLTSVVKWQFVSTHRHQFEWYLPAFQSVQTEYLFLFHIHSEGKVYLHPLPPFCSADCLVVSITFVSVFNRSHTSKKGTAGEQESLHLQGINREKTRDAYIPSSSAHRLLAGLSPTSLWPSWTLTQTARCQNDSQIQIFMNITNCCWFSNLD